MPYDKNLRFKISLKVTHLLGLEVVEGGCDLIGVGGVERLHGGGEHLRLHRGRLQHPMRGERGREVGRLELGCGGRGSWGRRKGRSNTVLKKLNVNLNSSDATSMRLHISETSSNMTRGCFC